jgi:hypothetical protein
LEFGGKMNVINGFMPGVVPAQNPSLLDEYFKDACNYGFIRKRVLDGELEQLPQQDRLFLLDFIAIREILHEAVRTNDELFVKALVKMGMDVNVKNTEGLPTFVYADESELFGWLLEHGAQCEAPMLSYVLKQSTRFMYKGKSQDKDSEGWFNILPSVMKMAAIDQFCALSYEEIKLMLDLAQTRPAIEEILWQVASKILEQEPQEVLKIAETMLEHREEVSGFFYLIKIGVIKDPYVEQIVTNAKILCQYIKTEAFFKDLSACWQPSGDLLALDALCNDFRLAVFCHAMLRTETLMEASLLCSCLGYFPNNMAFLEEKIKKCLVEHVQALQKKERTTIWHRLIKHGFGSNELLQMKHIGFDPNWTERANNRNFLFTKRAYYITDYECEEMQFNLDHVDSNGDNALDYHCRNPFLASRCISALSELGLTLSDHFPNIEKCRKVFPDNFYLQSILAAAHLNPQKNILWDLFKDISGEERVTFFSSVSNDPEFKEIASLGTVKRQREFITEGEKERWREKFHPRDLKKLTGLIKDNTKKMYSIVVLASFWKGCVPSEELNLIPESPLASLVIGVIKKQCQHDALGKQLISPSKLFDKLLSHNDMVFFNRYIFEHPELMNQIIQEYMKVKEITIKSGGGSISNHAEFVVHLILNLGNVLHVPEFTFQLPSWQNRLIKAFNQTLSPVVKETLDLSQEAQVWWLGRTAIVSGKEGCEAFKFLKKGEKYDYFSQEHSVSMAFNELAGKFRSEFIKPIGLYAIKQLPPALAHYRQQLGSGQPAIVYHYKALPETFEYLQDLPPEKYAAARSCSLHDAAKMVRMGIYPDLAAMFHNNEQGRKYTLLIDLMVLLIREYKGSFYAFEGGAGRLDQPFQKIFFPNMRASGLTDLRDASLLYGRENSLSYEIKDMEGLQNIKNDATRYFCQMHALSNVLLVDMLITSQRYIKDGLFQWQNDLLMKRCGNELAEGFAYVTASYSGKPYEKSLHFALQCGIDWTRASRQIAFWLDNGPNGYPAWVVQGEIPSGIYEDSIEVRIDVSKVENFDPVRGFSSNGHQDIGAYNGPLALTEFEKAMYLLFNAVALAEPLILF